MLNNMEYASNDSRLDGNQWFCDYKDNASRIFRGSTALATGKVVSVDWQGGLIKPLHADNADLIPYHKSDVWVDDKKVKQLPREGDMVTFYLSVDEISKKKAEQVTVVNASRTAHTAAPRSKVCSTPPRPTAPAVESEQQRTPTGKSNLNPAAPSFRPGPGSSPAPFVFEHCTGRVVAVNTPMGFIQIDGADENHPPVAYHYSDVWDDGKCVKQFPRVGDTVSCYITIDAKTKQEKAEMVKVIFKRQQAHNRQAAQQVIQTIQQAQLRTQFNSSIMSPHQVPPSPPLPLPAPLLFPTPSPIPQPPRLAPSTPPHPPAVSLFHSPAPITPPRPQPRSLENHLLPFANPLPPSPLMERVALLDKMLEHNVADADASTELAATLAAESVLEEDDNLSSVKKWARVIGSSDPSTELFEQKMLLRSPIMSRLPMMQETQC
eukprot:TRINITY_DN2529_c0_g1_i2.p1 TRINITY_DN2529_c0_g1~~TRINITY_DN2529_c0_g1_i2.p1  ORF type:complete len:435 (-),score=70.18 TRINITY_DN2529_c0_g1_i2:27-1331(-)